MLDTPCGNNGPCLTCTLIVWNNNIFVMDFKIKNLDY